MECDGNYHTIFSDIYDTDGARTRRIRRRCTCQMCVCVYSDDCPTRTLTLREMLTINLSHRIERALAYKDDVCISITHNCWANCLDQWGSIYFRHLYLVASNSKNVLTLGKCASCEVNTHQSREHTCPNVPIRYSALNSAIDLNRKINAVCLRNSYIAR